jgi:hypothetical protein
VIFQKWLTIGRGGSARLTAGKPSTRWNEVSILLEIELPKALFERPRLSASINIPDEAVGPARIDANVIENVREAIKTATGLEFHVSVVKDESDDNSGHEGAKANLGPE